MLNVPLQCVIVFCLSRSLVVFGPGIRLSFWHRGEHQRSHLTFRGGEMIVEALCISCSVKGQPHLKRPRALPHLRAVTSVEKGMSREPRFGWLPSFQSRLRTTITPGAQWSCLGCIPVSQSHAHSLEHLTLAILHPVSRCDVYFSPKKTPLRPPTLAHHLLWPGRAFTYIYHRSGNRQGSIKA